MPSKTDTETRNVSMGLTCESTDNRRNAIVTESTEAALPHDRDERREDRRARHPSLAPIGFDVPRPITDFIAGPQSRSCFTLIFRTSVPAHA